MEKGYDMNKKIQITFNPELPGGHLNDPKEPEDANEDGKQQYATDNITVQSEEKENSKMYFEYALNEFDTQQSDMTEIDTESEKQFFRQLNKQRVDKDDNILSVPTDDNFTDRPFKSFNNTTEPQEIENNIYDATKEMENNNYDTTHELGNNNIDTTHEIEDYNYDKTHEIGIAQSDAEISFVSHEDNKEMHFLTEGDNDEVPSVTQGGDDETPFMTQRDYDETIANGVSIYNDNILMIEASAALLGYNEHEITHKAHLNRDIETSAVEFADENKESKEGEETEKNILNSRESTQISTIELESNILPGESTIDGKEVVVEEEKTNLLRTNSNEPVYIRPRTGKVRDVKNEKESNLIRQGILNKRSKSESRHSKVHETVYSPTDTQPKISMTPIEFTYIDETQKSQLEAKDDNAKPVIKSIMKKQTPLRKSLSEDASASTTTNDSKIHIEHKENRIPKRNGKQKIIDNDLIQQNESNTSTSEISATKFELEQSQLFGDSQATTNANTVHNDLYVDSSAKLNSALMPSKSDNTEINSDKEDASLSKGNKTAKQKQNLSKKSLKHYVKALSREQIDNLASLKSNTMLLSTNASEENKSKEPEKNDMKEFNYGDNRELKKEGNKEIEKNGNKAVDKNDSREPEKNEQESSSNIITTKKHRANKTKVKQPKTNRSVTLKPTTDHETISRTEENDPIEIQMEAADETRSQSETGSKAKDLLKVSDNQSIADGTIINTPKQRNDENIPNYSGNNVEREAHSISASLAAKNSHEVSISATSLLIENSNIEGSIKKGFTKESSSKDGFVKDSSAKTKTLSKRSKTVENLNNKGEITGKVIKCQESKSATQETLEKPGDEKTAAGELDEKRLLSLSKQGEWAMVEQLLRDVISKGSRELATADEVNTILQIILSV